MYIKITLRTMFNILVLLAVLPLVAMEEVVRVFPQIDSLSTDPRSLRETGRTKGVKIVNIASHPLTAFPLHLFGQKNVIKQWRREQPRPDEFNNDLCDSRIFLDKRAICLRCPKNLMMKGTFNVPLDNQDTITKGSFEGFKMNRYVSFGGNDRITTIEEEAFKGLAVKKGLTVCLRGLALVQEKAFEGITVGGSFDLSYNNNLEEVRAEAFLGGAFGRLFFNSCLNLSIVGERAFEGVKVKGDLFLSSNSKLFLIKEYAFKDIRIEGRLDLGNNNLSSISASLFDGARVGGDLNLSHNNLTVIQNEAFKGLVVGCNFHLDGNPITTLKTGAFKGLTVNGDLFLLSKELSTIESGAFKGLALGLTSKLILEKPDGYITSKLTEAQKQKAQKEFDLAKGMTGRDDNACIRLGLFPYVLGAEKPIINQKQLDLFSYDVSHAGTLTRPATRFEKLIALTKRLENLTIVGDLSLSGDQITTIPKNAFKGLLVEGSFSFMKSKLVSIPKNAFKGLVVNGDLMLNWNENLVDIKAGAFNGSRINGRLYVNFNRSLKDIEAGAFNGLTVGGGCCIGDNYKLPPHESKSV